MEFLQQAVGDLENPGIPGRTGAYTRDFGQSNLSLLENIFLNPMTVVQQLIFPTQIGLIVAQSFCQ